MDKYEQALRDIQAILDDMMYVPTDRYARELDAISAVISTVLEDTDHAHS